MTNERILQITRVFLRVALASAFLVAVADRLGLLGPYGSRNVSWGDWKHFEEYVAVLNWFIPKALIPALSALETVIETGLGLGLLVGIYPRIVAWSSAVLLSSFALTMTIVLGLLAPLGYGVFTAIGAALLLGAIAAPHTLGVAETATDTKSRTRLSVLTDVLKI
jgi:putative oxidoreductase